MLAVFLVYNSIAGGTPQLRPSELKGRTGEVVLVGQVVGRVTGDERRDGLRFVLRDVEGTSTVPVVYRGSVPDMFRSGRDILVQGELRKGTFIAVPGTMKTKCPSKYSAKKET
jgi:cytochrome c-type biogenesis protein CcmE